MGTGYHTESGTDYGHPWHLVYVQYKALDKLYNLWYNIYRGQRVNEARKRLKAGAERGPIVNDYRGYFIVNNRAHVDVLYPNGAFAFSADTYHEACLEVDKMEEESENVSG